MTHVPLIEFRIIAFSHVQHSVVAQNGVPLFAICTGRREIFVLLDNRVPWLSQ